MNVVLLVMDTARADTVESVFSCSSTPAWPAVEGGTYFERASACAPWTLPSHASLFTGTTPSKHGAHANHKRLADTQVTLPEILERRGYETVAVSNNTWISDEFGFDRGFETFFKTWQYVQSDTDLGRIARNAEGIEKLVKAAGMLFDGNPYTNLLNAFYGQFFRKVRDDGAARTNEWITNWLTERDDSRPFFLFVNYLEPHLEYRPLRDYASEHLPEDVTYQEAMDVSQDAWGYIAGKTEITERDFDILRSLYRAEIDYLRERIQEVVDALERVGEWDDTLFIVTSDHGENIGEHGLMDHQYALYDTLVRVPLFVRGGPFEKGINDELVQLADVTPTILDILNIDAPDARNQFQGISFHPEVGETREFAVAEYLAPQPSMEALEKRVGELPEPVLKYDRSLRAIRNLEYKYIRGSDGSIELYNLRIDPDETNDLTETHDEVVDELDDRLDKWLESFEHADSSANVSMNDETQARLEDLGYLQ